MDNMEGKKFVASYSGGKDSVLAVYRALNAGLLPLGLMTTYDPGAGRSWFHGISESLLKRAAASLSIPLFLLKTSGGQYEENFEKALTEVKTHGAEVCVFGDIDIEEHLGWCTRRCENTGLTPYFPLLEDNREKLIYEFLDAGFSAVITVVNTVLLQRDFIGELLTREIVEAIKKKGADVCGENGEYHTFVFDGPVFTNKVAFSVKQSIERDGYAMLDLE